MNNPVELSVWTLAEITDPHFRIALSEQAENLTGLVHLHLADGVIEVSKRMAFINLFGWQILTEFNIPIHIRHFCKRKPLNNSAFVADWDEFYDEITALGPGNIERIRDIVWKVWQDLYVFCCEELLAYVVTMDILSISEILEDPKMKEIIDTKEKITPSMGSDVIEKRIAVGNKRIMELLSTKGALKNQTLYPYQQVRQLNRFQVPQTLYAFGVRTDISDNIVRLPVIGSAVSGIRNIREFAVESLAAKKATFYNKVAVPDSQYDGRVIQLITSSIQRLHRQSCGSNVLVPFDVTETNHKFLEGKVIYEHGKRIVLTRHTTGQYVGTQIQMKSPLTCRYRNGICEECGGALFQNLHGNVNVGLHSGVNLIEKVTQKILSAKHLINTKSLVYELPGLTSRILLRSSTHEISWHPDMYQKLKGLKMGIPLQFFGTLHDVKLLRTIKDVKPERFSSVEYIIIRDQKGKETTYPLKWEGQIPYFSSEVLIHLRDHYDELEIDEQCIWFPVDDTGKKVLFNTIVVNDNMLQFVKRVEQFLNSDVGGYSDCYRALKDFSDIIYDKSEINIAHIEVVLKAYLVTSSTDFRVPQVNDASHVVFGVTDPILSNRHIGPKLIYEKLVRFLSNPKTYLVRTQNSPLDVHTIGT